jgi:hypothetical protein
MGMTNLSAAWFAKMSAAGLVFNYFDALIAKKKENLSVKRHGDMHIGEKRFQIWHGIFPIGLLFSFQV